MSLFKKKKTADQITNNETFYALCRDCGSLQPEEKDQTPCPCGGIYHVDSARCLSCGGRHPFSAVEQNCNCGGIIAPKAVSCPGCGKYAPHEHLGEHCPTCNLELKLEG